MSVLVSASEMQFPSVYSDYAVIIRRSEHAESRSDGVIELKRRLGRKRTERVIPG